jgi:hypothetical protein
MSKEKFCTVVILIYSYYFGVDISLIDAGGVLGVSSSETLGAEKTTRWAEPCPLTKNLAPYLVSFRVTFGRSQSCMA